ncbi:MAG: UDP-N-acetylmuramoyl-L-alanine--D-glutamate ligase [Anaerolineales bacterium]|nr:UDP-N-acetylmuramoyl-L-alanine--D-glutamate ligase [Anaerolineales bacterium]HJO33708.1 UDP-N-acetylmuramoyl-L-alanine--D-glutamate ligase [Anaerolineales bacterium]
MRGKTAVVLGLARQGITLARYLAEHDASVRVSDLRSADELAPAINALRHYRLDFVLGEHPQSLLDGADIVFVSGGVPTDIPFLKRARERGISLSNDSQLFLERAPCKVVGVTGSSGKTTTTLLAGRMATAGGSFRQVWVGGNVGKPLLADVRRMTGEDVAIMELSSFQLEIMTGSLTVAAILNITPNHLDRHASMEDYVEAKARIIAGQSTGDVAVLGWDDETTRRLRERVRGNCWGFGLAADPGFADGCHLDGERIMLRRGNVSRPIAVRRDIRLCGAHNELNVLAAATLVVAAGVEMTGVSEAIRGFQGAPHRLELVREAKRVRWVNDTMATTPERTVSALQSFNAPVILLLGGRDKKLLWGALAERVKTGVKTIILFGEAASLIDAELGRAWFGSATLASGVDSRDAQIVDKGPGVESAINGSTAGEAVTPSPFLETPTVLRAEKLVQAVQQAADCAQAGDVVLLSPGCTSFDEYSDAPARGDQFRELVNRLP